MNSTLLPDPSEMEGVAPVPLVAGETGSGVASLVADAAPPSRAMRHLVSGTSALGLGVVIERGAGFVANILAARMGGASTFGAYSLAISTANNIATYAAAGIGSTAARFSGKYPHGTDEYGTLARVLGIVSLVSALAASIGLWLGAAPIARLLGQTRLTGLLHWAALSAAGIVLLECARGFFVGQRRLAALVLLSLIVGAGMLCLLPVAAHHHSPVRMIISQGAITLVAVLVCLLLSRPLGLLSPGSLEKTHGFAPMLREIWGFGFVQLAGLIGSNLAGWWLTTLVARADTSLVQMGFFGIASQLRNIVGLAPGLLTEGSYAIMADPEGERLRTPEHVLGLTTFVSSLAATLLASIGIVFAPWLLRLFYTAAYSQASVTVAVALALAVMHMGNAPASARLSIVSIRASGIINTAWAIFVAAVGTLVMLHGGSASMAMVIYLLAHGISSALVLLTLSRKVTLPAGLVLTFFLAAGGTSTLAALAGLRSMHPEQAVRITGLMGLFACVLMSLLLTLGRNFHWLPTRAAMARLLRYAGSSWSRLRGRSAHVL